MCWAWARETKAAGPHPLSKNISSLIQFPLKAKSSAKIYIIFWMTKQMNTFFSIIFWHWHWQLFFSEGSKRVRRKVIFIYINIKYYLNILSPISAASRNKNCQCQCQQKRSTRITLHSVSLCANLWLIPHNWECKLNCVKLQ